MHARPKLNSIWFHFISFADTIHNTEIKRRSKTKYSLSWCGDLKRSFDCYHLMVYFLDFVPTHNFRIFTITFQNSRTMQYVAELTISFKTLADFSKQICDTVAVTTLPILAIFIAGSRLSHHILIAVCFMPQLILSHCTW